ncbi:MAG: response regulator [Spartobacteria bacterium]|nr:response regulator [Spartobacteria bacterium]
MKTLIVEDDLTTRILLQRILEQYGATDIAVNGKEAVDAVKHALDMGSNYDLICLDIMMPEMDGQDALKVIRHAEQDHGIIETDGARIVMTTALSNPKNIITAFKNMCDAYLVKPVDKQHIVEKLRELNLISD